jgi:hypothetical protein
VPANSPVTASNCAYANRSPFAVAASALATSARASSSVRGAPEAEPTVVIQRKTSSASVPVPAAAR